ncbi:MAG: Hsp20 family protein [Hyphomicrobiaceae bacterium]
MARVTRLSSPMLLGFEEIESLIQRVGQKSSGDGYPPYNIERLASSEDEPERLRITLAVAGFTEADLDVTVEDRKLLIRGRQADDTEREYIYRGIAARQFQRSFLLADGIEVRTADLKNGMLAIDLVRLVPDRLVRRIEIGKKSPES